MANQLRLDKVHIRNYTMVRIHPQLHEALKELAAQDDRSLTKFIERKLLEVVNG